jgi:hypothetical protein
MISEYHKRVETAVEEAPDVSFSRLDANIFFFGGLS